MRNDIRVHRRKRQIEAKKNGEKTNRFTQQALADVLSVPRSRISMIETGQAIPTVQELETIARELDVTVGQLITTKQLDFLLDQ